MVKENRKTVGLALGSGGGRGFCHIGVLQVLKENNIPIDYMSGCSMGAMVGACYCAGVEVEKMNAIASKITQRKIMDIDISIKKSGVLRGDRAISYISELIGDAKFEDCEIPFAVTATDVLKGELVTFTKGVLTDAVRASMSLPVVFQSVNLDGKDCLIDGGVIERIPIKAVRDFGADVVIAVDALGPPTQLTEIKGLLNMTERAYLLMDWESSKVKLAEADLVITPEQGNRSIQSFKNNKESIEYGAEATRKMIPKIKELIGIE